jgi:hypothetical protein
VVPLLQQLVLETPTLFPVETCDAILLRQEEDRVVTLSRKQAACILVRAMVLGSFFRYFLAFGLTKIRCLMQNRPMDLCARSGAAHLRFQR